MKELIQGESVIPNGTSYPVYLSYVNRYVFASNFVKNTDLGARMNLYYIMGLLLGIFSIIGILLTIGRRNKQLYTLLGWILMLFLINENGPTAYTLENSHCGVYFSQIGLLSRWLFR